MRATRQKGVNIEANQLTGRPVRYLVNRLTDVCDHDDDDDDDYFDYFDDCDDLFEPAAAAARKGKAGW